MFLVSSLSSKKSMKTSRQVVIHFLEETLHNGRSLYWASSIFITPKNEICFLRHEGVAPTWHCHALALLAPNSWDQELSADVKFSSVLWMVLSEYWKRLEKIFRFFGNENELSSSNVSGYTKSRIYAGKKYKKVIFWKTLTEIEIFFCFRFEWIPWRPGTLN